MAYNPKLLSLSKKSQLMKIDINYGGEEIKFNLFRELDIREDFINDEIHDHGKAYSFLAMLHKKLIKQAKGLELKAKNQKHKAYIKYRTEGYQGKMAAKDLAEALAHQDKAYQITLKKFAKVEDDRDLIEVCVKAFESRKDLIQTLSANTRSQKM